MRSDCYSAEIDYNTVQQNNCTPFLVFCDPEQNALFTLVPSEQVTLVTVGKLEQALLNCINLLTVN